MRPRTRVWGHYLVIFLPIGAGIGAIVGEAIDRPLIWALGGAAAGIVLSLWLARTTPPGDNP